MKENKNKPKGGNRMFNKLSKVMTWAMLTVLFTGVALPTVEVLADEIDKVSITDTSNTNEMMSEASEPKVENTEVKIEEPVVNEKSEKVEEKTESKPNAPNEVEKKEEVKEVKEVKEELLSDAKKSNEVGKNLTLGKTGKGVNLAIVETTPKDVDAFVNSVDSNNIDSKYSVIDEPGEKLSPPLERLDYVKSVRSDKTTKALKNSKAFIEGENILNKDMIAVLEKEHELPVSINVTKKVLDKYDLTSAGDAVLVIKALDPKVYSLLTKEQQAIVNSVVTPDYVKDGVNELDMARFENTMIELDKSINKDIYDINSNHLSYDDIKYVENFLFGYFSDYIKFDGIEFNQYLKPQSRVYVNDELDKKFPMTLSYSDALGLSGKYVVSAHANGQIIEFFRDGNAGQPDAHSQMLYCAMGLYDNLGGAKPVTVYYVNQDVAKMEKDGSKFPLDKYADGGQALGYARKSSDPMVSFASYQTFINVSRWYDGPGGTDAGPHHSADQVYDKLNASANQDQPTPFKKSLGLIDDRTMAENNFKSDQVKERKDFIDLVDYKGFGDGFKWAIRYGDKNEKSYDAGEIILDKFGDTADTKIPVEYMDDVKNSMSADMKKSVKLFEKNGTIWVEAVATTSGETLSMKEVKKDNESILHPLQNSMMYSAQYSPNVTGTEGLVGAYSTQSKIGTSLWGVKVEKVKLNLSVKVNGFFGFGAKKIVTMTGSQQNVTNPVGKNSEFTSNTHGSIINGKVDLTKAIVELQYQNGKPVKWTDDIMSEFNKDENKNVTKGKVNKSNSNVRFNLDKEGGLEVHTIIYDDKGFQLVEVATPDRTNLSSDVIKLDIDGKLGRLKPYEKDPFKGEPFDNVTGTPFKNNIDYTGVKLIKKGHYLGTDFGSLGGNYDPAKDTLGNATFVGAEYTMYYGDGDKKDQPVMNGDYVIEKMTLGDLNGAKTTKSTTGAVVFEVQPNGLVAVLDNVIFGSYYLLETKSAIGQHLDKTKYYFGDKVGVSKPDVYLEPVIKDANDNGIGATNSGHKDVSASKESEGITTDNIRLISSELEKRTKYLQADSPFQTAERGTWGNGGNDIKYKHGDVNTIYIDDTHTYGDDKLNDLGSTRRAEAVYGLFYYMDTLDGQGKKGQPVKLTDRVVEHMQVTKGRPVDKDYKTVTGKEINGTKDVIIRLSDEKDTYAELGVKDLAYGSYYWKELEAPHGMAIDPKEYIFGVGQDAKPNYVGNGSEKLDTPETQTSTNITKVDDEKNYDFSNTFKNDKPHGSTDTILTFGFSGSKVAVYDSDSAVNNGENGVKLTLTPYGDTLGYPITTTSHKTYVKDNSGKVQTVNGYYEFRTVPIGTYIMTSEGEDSQVSDNPESLLNMKPIFVEMVQDGDDYILSFYMDMNETGDIGQSYLLSSYSSKDESFMPKQSGLDALVDGVDGIKDGYGEGKNGSDVDEGEDHIWQRPNNKDTHEDGSKNNNFISAEVNLDYAGFDIVDATPPIKDDAVEFKSEATNKEDGTHVLPANQKEVVILDRLTFIKTSGLVKGNTYTFKAVPMLKSTGQSLAKSQNLKDTNGKQIGDTVYHTFKYDGQPYVDVDVPVSTEGLNGEEIVIYEYLYEGEVTSETKDPILLFSEEDMEDASQTVKVEHEGEIGTTATNTSGGNDIYADKNQVIRDKIDLTKSNLKDGGVYTITKPVPTLPWKDGLTSNEPVTFDKLDMPIKEMTAVLDTKGNKAIALPYLSAVVEKESNKHTYTDSEGKEQSIILKDDQFVYRDGMESVTIVVSGIDMTGYRAGQDVVMFEEITGDDIKPLIHADINDKSQTVTVKASLQTLFQTGTTPNGVIADAKKEDIVPSKFYTPGKLTQTVDYVTFRGAIPNKEQTIKGILMTPAKNDKGYTPYLDLYGKEVKASYTFTPTTPNGIVRMYFTFVANMDELNIVAFEKATYTDGDKPYAEHEDINDKGQTITPLKPQITTKATSNGEKEVNQGKDVPLHEEAVIDNVIEGSSYKALIKLWRVRNNDTSTAELVWETDKDFVADADSHEEVVDTLVDTSQDEPGTYYVFTEELLDGEKPNNELANHNDLNNKEQTVTVVGKPLPKDPENNPSSESFAKAGEQKTIILTIVGLIILVSVVGYIIYTKRQSK